MRSICMLALEAAVLAVSCQAAPAAFFPDRAQGSPPPIEISEAPAPSDDALAWRRPIRRGVKWIFGRC